MLLSLAHTLKFILGHPLNRSRKIAALMTFFRWQIGSRIVPGQVLFTWINGTKMVSRPGDTGFTQNIYCGLHEKESLHSVILELNNSGLRYGFDEEHILMTMQESGFYPYAYNPFSRKLEHLSGKNTSSGNTLFIRNTEAIQEKVKAAPKVLINGICL